MSKRRRLPNNNLLPDDANIEIDEFDREEEARINEILQLLEDESDEENNRPPPIIPLGEYTRRSTSQTQRKIYVGIFALLVFFMLWVNYYNHKQLERIKEEYGPEKKVEPELWWQKALIYHVYVRSFRDSNGDGIGDLKGLRLHLDHFIYLGVDAIQLSDIFESPMKDYGRDVSNFTNIDPLYGTLEDFKDLVSECHEKGIKIYLELVPNHTSKRHPWFEQSRKGGKINKYKHYYLWSDGKALKNGTILPPNNWLSIYGGSAWTYDSERGQFYYHKFHSSMPDLNHRERGVQDEVTALYTHWLQNYDLDGLVLADVHLYFEADDMSLDEPTSDIEGIEPGEYDFLEHIYTEDHADIHDFLANWREVIDKVAAKKKRRIPLLVDVTDEQVTDIIKYYFTGGDMVTCRQLMKVDTDCAAYCVQDLVEVIKMHMPDEKDPLWMLGGPDDKRLSSIKGGRYQNVLLMLLMLLPGAARSFQGDELGLGNTMLPYQETIDIKGRIAGPAKYTKYTRDYARGPIPWDEKKSNYGFSTADKPWMPFANDVGKEHTVEHQRNEHFSAMNLYGRLARLRKEHSFVVGEFQYSLITEHLFSFMRFAKNAAPYVVIMNVGEEADTRDYTPSAGVQYGKVIVHAKPNGEPGTRRTYVEGKTVNLEKITLQPGEGLVCMLLLDMVLM